MSRLIEKLLDNQTATGGWVKIGPGPHVLDCVGTFNGATVKMQRKASDGATALDVGSDATFTAPGHTLVTICEGEYRMFVSGGPPSGLYSWARPAF